MKTIYKDDIILKLNIEKESYRVIILDSYYILTYDWKDPCIKYEINVIKKNFSYKLLTQIFHLVLVKYLFSIIISLH